MSGEIDRLDEVEHQWKVGLSLSLDYQKWLIDEVKRVRGLLAAHERGLEADARLIAAAPELLEELRLTHAGLLAEADDLICSAGHFDGGSANTCLHCQYRAWLARIEVVIAKAEGSV